MKMGEPSYVTNKKEKNMSTSTSATIETRQPKPASWWEIASVIVIYLAISFLVPSLKQIIVLPLIAYMVIESWLRQRSWTDNGFGMRDIPAGFRKTIGWFLLVVFGTQFLCVFGEHFFLPEVSAHIIKRIPYDVFSLNVGFFISLAIATFLEELLFRALFQNRLSAFISPTAAIGLVSLVFAIAHFDAGPALVVFIDLLGVFVDSVIYGIIFQRSGNVFVSWVPHYLADIVALLLILALK
jgi:membrane protease YdiL (CAAX protease family)